MTIKKPPTQTAGVEGIAPKPIELTPAQPQQIDWAKLCELPPFQMFAVEKMPSLAEAFSRFTGDPEVISWMQTYTPENLYSEYCDWHQAKGYWPNETPTGELI